MSEDEHADEQPVINVQSKHDKPSIHITFGPSLIPPMATLVSRADRERIDEIRARSIDLAYARGHITRA